MVSAKTPKRQPKLTADSLIKPHKEGDVELAEEELGGVSGGGQLGPDNIVHKHVANVKWTLGGGGTNNT